PFLSGRSGRLFGGFGRLVGVRRSIVRGPRHYRDEGPAADPLLELDGALVEREKGVVAPHADPVTRVELGAALAHDDVAGDDDLATVFLDAEPASGAVAAVARRAARFFVCHLEPSCAASAADNQAPGWISVIRS